MKMDKVSSERIAEIYEGALIKKLAEGTMSEEEKELWEMLRNKKKEEIVIRARVLGNDMANICNSEEEFEAVLAQTICELREMAYLYLGMWKVK